MTKKPARCAALRCPVLRAQLCPRLPGPAPRSISPPAPAPARARWRGWKWHGRSGGAGRGSRAGCLPRQPRPTSRECPAGVVRCSQAWGWGVPTALVPCPGSPGVWGLGGVWGAGGGAPPVGTICALIPFPLGGSCPASTCLHLPPATRLRSPLQAWPLVRPPHLTALMQVHASCLEGVPVFCYFVLLI